MWWKDPQPRSVLRTARRLRESVAPSRVAGNVASGNPSARRAAEFPWSGPKMRAPQDLFGNLGGEPIPDSILNLNQELRREPTIARPSPAIPRSRPDSRSLPRTTLKQLADQRRAMRTDLHRLETTIRQLADDCLVARREGMHFRVAAEASQTGHADAQREIARLQQSLASERTDAEFALAQVCLDHTLESRAWLTSEQQWRDETESMGTRLKTLAEQLARARAERAQILELLRDERNRRRLDRRALDQKHQRDIRTAQEQVVRLTDQLQDTTVLRDRAATQHWRGIEQTVRRSRWARATRCRQRSIATVAPRFTDTTSAENTTADTSAPTDTSLPTRFRRAVAEQLASNTQQQAIIQASIHRRFRSVAPITAEPDAAREPSVAQAPPSWDALNGTLDQVAFVVPIEFVVSGEPTESVTESDEAPSSLTESAEDETDKEDETVRELGAELAYANQFAEALGQRLLESERSRQQLRQALAAGTVELENLRRDHQTLRDEHQGLEDRLRRRNRQLARRQDREREWSARHDDQVADLIHRMELMIQELAIAASQPPVPVSTDVSNSETERAMQRRIDQQDSELLRFERHVEILRELIRQGRTRAQTTIARYERQVARLESVAARRRAA